VTRLHALAAHPRRTLAALAVVLAAVGITVGSGANFTASAASPGNSFATGTLTMTAPNTAVFTSAGMKPGATATGNVSIQNTGSLSGVFKLATANPTNSALLGQLNTVVTDCGAYTTTPPSCTGGNDVYTGALSGLSNASLGTYAGNEKHYYKIAVTLDSNTDNSFQGQTATVDFAWSATQS
jgi:camelysin-like metallo-endopeptidase